MVTAQQVLILDDDPDIINFLTHELKKIGVEVSPAANADQALKLLNANQYLCAIVDIVLGPNMTSEKVIQFLKQGPVESARKTPLIITSSFMNPDYAKKIEEKGINIYKAIPKPFKPGQLSKVVTTLQADLKSGLFTPIDPKLLYEDENSEPVVASPKTALADLDDRVVHVEEAWEQHKVNSAVMAQDDINYRNEEGESALMIFASKGRADLVGNLLSLGADPNIKSRKGRTAIHYAVTSGSTEILNLLIAAGAKVNARDDDNKDALFLAMLNGDYLLVDYLINHGARLDAKVEGKSYLFWALETDQLPIFNRLLAAGADPKVKNPQGKDLKQLAREANKNHFLRIIGTLGI